MRYFLLLILTFLSACSSITIPENYVYKEIQTTTFALASWQKITNKTDPIRIYVEGDGYAFDQKGNPTDDPTPISTLVRELAFNDYNSNVVYLARPCQFIQTKLCTADCWSAGRFSYHAAVALYEASKKISQGQHIIYIGYSGGALLTGLVIQEFPDLPVKKWITLAGLLNHKAWSEYLHLYPLTHSMNLQELPAIEQKHFIGDKDAVIPLPLMRQLADEKNLIIIPNAGHNKGLKNISSLLYKE